MQLLAGINPILVQAYYAPRPFAFEHLKMLVEDSLEENYD
jgi:hypothetical protein